MPSAKKAAPAKKPAAKAAAPASERNPAAAKAAPAKPAAAKAPSAKTTAAKTTAAKTTSAKTAPAKTVPAKTVPATKEAPAATSKAARKVSAPESADAVQETAGAKKAAPAPRSSSTKAPSTRKLVEHDPKFLDEQRVALAEEREGYERQIAALKAEADQLAAEAEPGDVQFDDESGEGDTMSIERERDLALIANARRTIEDIDRALEKIDAGTYGICERCGQPILKARLKALPFATECVACKSGGLSARR